jgi:hypothetical protein
LDLKSESRAFRPLIAANLLWLSQVSASRSLLAFCGV